MKSITCTTCGLALADVVSECECESTRELVVIDDEDGTTTFLRQVDAELAE